MSEFLPVLLFLYFFSCLSGPILTVKKRIGWFCYSRSYLNIWWCREGACTKRRLVWFSVFWHQHVAIGCPRNVLYRCKSNSGLSHLWLMCLWSLYWFISFTFMCWICSYVCGNEAGRHASEGSRGGKNVLERIEFQVLQAKRTLALQGPGWNITSYSL